ncbi:ead/Ea22-like family protein [Enterobacter roggenkampii]|uniref:ead/Ea22-like family protein n=1 Tax=Enterobacter roggenkampii TaxID=1812935 RepID=UPI003BD08023
MSNIDKRALREAANAANAASWGNWEPYKPHKGARGYEVKVGVKAVAQHCLKVDSVFIAAANPATVLALLDELEAAEKLIAELELKLEAADKLQDSAFRHGLQHGFSYGQTDNQAGFEQAIQVYGQQWKGE